MINRQKALQQWLEKIIGHSLFSMRPLAGDASYRRYYRLSHDGITKIVMDAPPDSESLDSFLRIAELLNGMNIRTPKIHSFNKEQGFAILDDFGDIVLLNQLKPDSADNLYNAAIDIVLRMQNNFRADLPPFNKSFILYELSLFKEWFLQGYLNLQLNNTEEEILDELFEYLCNELIAQPQVFIHRDYHSRNLMLLHEERTELGVIDFQDAMVGPFTYDLVSLLKDCYIQWPKENLNTWLNYFYSRSAIAKEYALPKFIRAFDYSGLQRHLKVLGIFSRLHLRDKKSNYLRDLPLTLHYVLSCLEEHKELDFFYQFMRARVNLI